MQRRRISVSLSEKLASRLDKVITNSGRTESEIVRVALHDYLKKEEGGN